MKNQPTENYFLESSFNEESLLYFLADLTCRRQAFEHDHDFYKSQADMFNRLAERALANIGGVDEVFNKVNTALREVRFKKKGVS